MLKRLMLVTALVALLLVACGGGGGSTPPAIQLVVNEQPVSGFTGSYCWNRLCADAVPPEFDDLPLQSVSGPIILKADRPAPDRIFLSLSTEVFGDQLGTLEVTDTDNVEWNTNLEPGIYILSISAQWDKGDASYYYKIEIE